MTIDTTNMCSHLQRKLFEKDGIYHSLWMVMQDDSELTVVVRSRQLHIYRNGKKAASKREQGDACIGSAEHEQARRKVKVLVLAGKSAPKIIREDSICELLQIERIKWMEQRFNIALAAIKDESAASLKAIKDDVAELSNYYGSELWKLDFAADEAGKLPTSNVEYCQKMVFGICSPTIVIFKRRSNEETKNQVFRNILHLLVCPFGLAGGWISEIPDIG